MGKGDKKSRRGKIAIGSHGVSRPKKTKNRKALVKNPGGSAAVVEKPKKESKSKKK